MGAAPKLTDRQRNALRGGNFYSLAQSKRADATRAWLASWSTEQRERAGLFCLSDAIVDRVTTLRGLERVGFVVRVQPAHAGREAWAVFTPSGRREVARLRNS